MAVHHRIYIAYRDASHHPHCVDHFAEYVTHYKKLAGPGPDACFID